MIEKQELLEIAKINGLRPWQQEKHYIQALILGILSEHPLVFKRETYLWFFHGLPRFSEDLDFTSIEELKENLPELVSKSLEFFGIQNTLKIISNNERSLSFRISAKGPLNTKHIDECRVYVEISKMEKIEEKTLSLKFDFPAYNLPIKRLLGMNLNEVSAEKVRAIITREKARDLFDLNYLITRKKALFNEELINKKLYYYGKQFSRTDFLKKAKQKQKYCKKELENILFDELPKFQQIIQTLQKWSEKNK